MTFIEKLQQIKRLDSLIRRRATGSPSELAERLELSERQLYNIMNMLKDMDAPVAYSTGEQTYYYERNVKLILGFENENVVKGGVLKNSWLNIDLLKFYFSDGHHIHNMNSLRMPKSVFKSR